MDSQPMTPKTPPPVITPVTSSVSNTQTTLQSVVEMLKAVDITFSFKDLKID